RHSNHRKVLGEQVRLLKVIKRRQQLALRQVSRCSEDHHNAGIGLALRVARLRCCIRIHLNLCCSHIDNPPRTFSVGLSVLTGSSRQSAFLTSWPPKAPRIIEIMRSVKLFSSRERSLRISDSVITG